MAGRGASGIQANRPLACAGQLHAGLQLTWASENRPCYPERVSGDLAFIRPGPEGVSLILIDVSGHGTSANKLVQVLEAALQQTREQEPARLLQLLHQHCIGTGAPPPAWPWSTANGVS